MKFAAFVVSASVLALAACSDGPAEEAGEDLDDAIEEVTDEDVSTFEEAGEEMDEAADEPTRR
ncbi:hypothetical protein [Maricaulis sp. CAU 1757]